MWECQEQSACQCIEQPNISPAKGPMSYFEVFHSDMLLPKYSLDIQDWASWDERKLACCWRRLVQHYTTLGLTRASDVFPAISGIASRFQAANKSKSLAGLWEKTLLSDLLWYVSIESITYTIDFSRLGHRPAFRAPSWSWASVSLPVQSFYIHHGEELEPNCSVRKAICQPRGADFTGDVHSGHIVLQGNLIPTVLEHHPDIQNTPQLRHYKLSVLNEPDHHIHADCNTSVPGENYLSNGPEVYCFPVVRYARTQTQSIGYLLLRKVGADPEEDCGVYARIGSVLATPFPFNGGQLLSSVHNGGGSPQIAFIEHDCKV